LFFAYPTRKIIDDIAKKTKAKKIPPRATRPANSSCGFTLSKVKKSRIIERIFKIAGILTQLLFNLSFQKARIRSINTINTNKIKIKPDIL
jgi:hypothetical protein